MTRHERLVEAIAAAGCPLSELACILICRRAVPDASYLEMSCALADLADLVRRRRLH